MIVQQIDLVHIQEVAVGLGQDPALVFSFSSSQDMLDVEASGDTVLCGVQRKFYDPHGAGERFVFALGYLLLTVVAQISGVGGIAMELASGYRLDLRKYLFERSDRCGFRCTLLPPEEDSAYTWVDNVQ